MSILGQILEQGKSFSEILRFNRKVAQRYQMNTLKKMLYKAQNTAFGKEYGFSDILIAKDIYQTFQEKVPVSNYSLMFPWWQRAYKGEANVCWPGKTKYFAMSSGTTEGASKYIPFTTDMMKAITRASTRQMIQIVKTDIPKDYLAKNYLMIGGSTDLHFDGKVYSGDLSGITASNLPGWFERFSRPGDEIRREKDWKDKIARIAKHAPEWDVVMIAGVPAWIKLMFETIIEKYHLKTIHDLWPNLMVYLHGGVALEPYRKSLDALTGKPLMYFETYLASEGFVAYQRKLDSTGMRLVLKNNMFYEFVPFTSENFTETGEMKPNPQVLGLDEVEEGKEYAILLTTCSGAWRYMIGDTIRFTNLDQCEIKITGRTKHFLSLCGEHLSVDNMNKAIEMLSEQYNCPIAEFTVKGVPYQGFFAHQWFIACDNNHMNPASVRIKLDDALKFLNDDYKTERLHALKDVLVELLPEKVFMSWMEKKGKMGSQHKFPRVLSDELYADWVQHVKEWKASSKG